MVMGVGCDEIWHRKVWRGGVEYGSAWQAAGGHVATEHIYALHQVYQSLPQQPRHPCTDKAPHALYYSCTQPDQCHRHSTRVCALVTSLQFPAFPAPATHMPL